MKICIPTKGRPGKVDTIKHFRPEQVYLFVEPAEVATYAAAYPGVNIVDIQQTNQGVVYVRNFILDYNKEKFIMLDDDITRFFIRDEGVESKYTWLVTMDGIDRMLKDIEKKLDSYAMIVVPKRNYAKLEDGGIKDYGLARHFFAINPSLMPADLRFDPATKLLEDLDISMQMLFRKVPYGLDYGFCLYAKYVSPGGNSSDYAEDHASSQMKVLEILKKKWGPNFISLRKKKDGTSLGFGPNYRQIRKHLNGDKHDIIKKPRMKRLKEGSWANSRILIDGVDGCGKTTVCKLLSEKTKLPIIKMPNMKEYFTKGTTEEFSKLFNECVIQFSQYPFIMDRGFTSSIVYNTIYNRGFDLSYLTEIEKKLDPKVFILTAKPVAFLKRRPMDDIITAQKRLEINDEFLSLAEERGYHVIDTTELTPEQVLEEVLNKL